MDAKNLMRHSPRVSRGATLASPAMDELAGTDHVAGRDQIVELLKLAVVLERAFHSMAQFRHTTATRLGAAPGSEGAFSGYRPSPAQIQMVIELSEHGPRTISDLATRLRVTPSAVSLLVDRMESHGVAERVRSTLDRRVVTVQLTERVAIFADAMIKTQREQVALFLAQTPMGDRAPFLRHLARYVEAIDQVNHLAAMAVEPPCAVQGVGKDFPPVVTKEDIDG